MNSESNPDIDSLRGISDFPSNKKEQVATTPHSMILTAPWYARLNSSYPLSATMYMAASATCQLNLPDCRDLRPRADRLLIEQWADWRLDIDRVMSMDSGQRKISLQSLCDSY
jgi:hypothetical protein